MQVPLQAPLRQYEMHKEILDAAVLAVLSSGRWLFGSEVESFEKEFAEFCGVPFVCTVANGSDALEIALTTAGARGREVITAANAGGYTTTACRVIGAVPAYVDIVPETLLLSISAVLGAVTSRTAAVVVTHLYGRMVDVPALRTGLESLGRTDIVIIEDCAQAHGAVLNGQRAGSFGDLATYSFYPTKNLGGMGDGGAIACKKAAHADMVSMLRQYGWSKRYCSKVPYGRNSRMDEIQAAILRCKLPLLDTWNAKRREILAAYEIASAGGFGSCGQPVSSCVAHLAVYRHPERDRVREFFSQTGVATDVHYPTLDCDQPSQQGLPMIVHDLTQSRNAVKEIFTLPCFPEMTEEEVSIVVKAIRSYSITHSL